MSVATLSLNSVPEQRPVVLGRTVPRLWTPPLVTGPPGPCGCGCALSPESSYGFDVVEFATTFGLPPDPWQRWCAIHLGELLPDGRPRFRKVLILVARQNGKTWLTVILTLFWLYVDQAPMVLGTSTQVKYAKESWLKVVKAIKQTTALRALLPPTRNMGIRQANGEQEVAVLREVGGDVEDACRYLIATANEEGGRSLTINKAVLDELRQHHDYSAWDAVIPAQNAVPDAQAVAISNAGSGRSVVLNDLRAAALRYIDTGEGDERLALIEYSSPEGSDPLDVEALAQANPNLGRRLDADALLAEARAAVAAGGEKLAGFMTEAMCLTVSVLDPAVDPGAWDRCARPDTLDAARGRVVLCLDISPDELHATLTAAASMPDGRIRVEPVKAWSGTDATAQARRDLPALVERVKPRVLGWLPGGPAASLAVWLRTAKLRTRVEEIKADLPSVSMGFAEQVRSEEIWHSADPLLDAQVRGASKLHQGDRWVMSRKHGHCDAAYSTAGAVHLARAYPALKVRKVLSVPRA